MLLDTAPLFCISELSFAEVRKFFQNFVSTFCRYMVYPLLVKGFINVYNFNGERSSRLLLIYPVCLIATLGKCSNRY